MRRLSHKCHDGSIDEVAVAVQALARTIREEGLAVPPGAAAETVLANDVHAGADCQAVAAKIVRELAVPSAHTDHGWGGYAGTLAAWHVAHRSGQRYDVSGPGRVFSLVGRFSPPLTADLALALVRHSLLPGKVRTVYALKAAQCQQAIYFGHTLGRLFGKASLGAFVQLTTGKGAGRTRYDAGRVNRVRITPFGRIGGQPCT